MLNRDSEVTCWKPAHTDRIDRTILRGARDTRQRALGADWSIALFPAAVLGEIISNYDLCADAAACSTLFRFAHAERSRVVSCASESSHFPSDYERRLLRSGIVAQKHLQPGRLFEYCHY